MFLFLKLVLAHLVADFVLQFEELYRLKLRGFAGHLGHVLIHGAVSALLLLPYLNEPVILFYVIFLTVEHLLQDLAKYHFTQKIPGQRFVFFTADQFLHFAALALIFLFPVSNEIRGFPGPEMLGRAYQDPAVTSFFIFYILLTFAGNYTLNSFYKAYVKTSRSLHWITSPEMAMTLLERSVIAAAVLSAPGPLWVAASLLIGLARLPFPELRKPGDFSVSAGYTLLLSYSYTLFL